MVPLGGETSGIEKKIVREENEIQKNENESEDGVQAHFGIKEHHNNTHV